MKVTERGQITIPKELREKYGISPSSEIELIDRPEGILIVKRVAGSPFRKFLGKANAAGLPETTDEFLDLVRDGEEPGEAGSSEAEQESERGDPGR